MKPSPFLFAPVRGKLTSLAEAADPLALGKCDEVARAIAELVGLKGYPCVPAQVAFSSDDYLVGIYPELGGGSAETVSDLIFFRNRQKESNSLFMSFFAVYLDAPAKNEQKFEEVMWQELSNLSAKDDLPWDPHFSSNPADQNFCFSLGGDAFFTVGMHPHSSRKARRMRFSTIVFNLFEQFEELERKGRYASTVSANRKLDIALQGSINPMVKEYGDKWESIQFSGKANPPNWQCPFQHKGKLLK